MSSGPPQANNHHLFVQQAQVTSITKAADAANRKVEKLEQEWRKAVSRGDRGKAMRLQADMNKAQSDAIKKGKKVKEIEKKARRRRW